MLKVLAAVQFEKSVNGDAFELRVMTKALVLSNQTIRNIRDEAK